MKWAPQSLRTLNAPECVDPQIPSKPGYEIQWKLDFGFPCDQRFPCTDGRAQKKSPKEKTWVFRSWFGMVNPRFNAKN